MNFYLVGIVLDARIFFVSVRVRSLTKEQRKVFRGRRGGLDGGIIGLSDVRDVSVIGRWDIDTLDYMVGEGIPRLPGSM